MEKMKILLITPTSEQVVGFRKNLIERWQAAGFDVAVLTFDDACKQTIVDRGVEFYCVQDKNRSMNPFAVLSLESRYRKVIREIKPDIVFTFMLKPNTFGVLAAKKAGVGKIYSMVEGAGDVFINRGLKWKIIRAFVCYLYKKAFKNSRKVFFLNGDDRNEFIARKLVKPGQCEVVCGIGVDLEKFAYKPIKNHRTFLMIARMLKTKGVYEYCEAARRVKLKYPDAVFNYLGMEGTVKLSDIQEYLDDGSVNYLGTTSDVRPYLDDCSVYVLPSYREGLSVSIMEAQAVGRATITTEANGCRDTVENGQNGFLVEVGNVDDLVGAMEFFLTAPDKVDEMSVNARRFAEEKFDKDKINDKILGVVYE